LGHDPEEDGNKVWGKVFRLTAKVMEEEMAKLEHREKAGYDKTMVKCYSPDGSTYDALVFRATPDNEHFIGAREVEAMAKHIKNSHGPSGPNEEYFVNLFLALEDMETRLGIRGIVDPHMAAIKGHL